MLIAQLFGGERCGWQAAVSAAAYQGNTMRSLHALVQECSRAIASHVSPAESFPDIAKVLVDGTGAQDAAILTGYDANAARLVCVETSAGGMVVTAPVKQTGRVFGVLRVAYASAGERPAYDHALSDIIGAVGLALGNALALAETSSPTYDEYLRAHLALYRSYSVPFTIATYDLRDRPLEARAGAAAALRTNVRRSDAVFELEGGLIAILLANCPLAGAHIATQRILQVTGLNTAAVMRPRRGESARHFQIRSERVP